MGFMIMDGESGNAIGFYDDEAEARADFAQIFEEDPSLVNDFALFEYDDVAGDDEDTNCRVHFHPDSNWKVVDGETVWVDQPVRA
jgi:hypothetical protein